VRELRAREATDVSYPVRVILDLLAEEGVLLESVKATVTVEQLRRGVDLLRVNGNEITFIAGHTVENQVWQSVRVSCEDPSTTVSLSVGSRIVGSFSVGAKQRLAKMSLIASGSVVRAVALSPTAPAAVRVQVALEIFGWGVTQEMLPAVREAILLTDAS
jgi:hypothetical protein